MGLCLSLFTSQNLNFFIGKIGMTVFLYLCFCEDQVRSWTRIYLINSKICYYCKVWLFWEGLSGKKGFGEKNNRMDCFVFFRTSTTAVFSFNKYWAPGTRGTTRNRTNTAAVIFERKQTLQIHEYVLRVCFSLTNIYTWRYESSIPNGLCKYKRFLWTKIYVEILHTRSSSQCILASSKSGKTA